MSQSVKVGRPVEPASVADLEPLANDEPAAPVAQREPVSPPRQRRRRGWAVRRKLMVADLLGLAGAYVLLILWLPSSGADRVPVDGELLVFVCSLPVLDSDRPGNGPLQPGRGTARAHDG